MILKTASFVRFIGKELNLYGFRTLKRELVMPATLEYSMLNLKVPKMCLQCLELLNSFVPKYFEYTIMTILKTYVQKRFSVP